MKTNIEFAPPARFYIDHSNLQLANGDSQIRELIRQGIRENVLRGALKGILPDVMASHMKEIDRHVGNTKMVKVTR